MADECPPCEEGLPPWLATFADLMSLLMCFFVLLLSFAEMDAIRFKKMAESMKDAFGVQKQIPANEIVKGTSVIMQEYSPGKPQPTPVPEIQQITTEEEKQNVELNEEVMDAVQQELEQQAQEKAEELHGKLEEEIDDGMVEIETDQTRIIVRIREQGSFSSGSAQLNAGFFEVMDKISGVVANMQGKIVVAGHTDNIPISTQRFRSNWELSSARAVTVVHALLSHPEVDMERVKIEGYADTRPLEPNDTPDNRARNRRVELIIEQGQHKDSGEVIQVQEDKG